MACKRLSKVNSIRGGTEGLWALQVGRALLLLYCRGVNTGFMDEVDSVVGGRNISAEGNIHQEREENCQQDLGN